MAGALNSFETHFSQLLVQHLDEEIAAKMEHLANGDCIEADNINATAQNYVAAVHYVRGLRKARKAMYEIEQQLLKSG